eukprot:1048637_1
MPSRSTRIEKRPPPDIRGGTVDIADLKLRIDTLLPNRRMYRNNGGGFYNEYNLPTDAEIKESKLTRNGEQLARATALMERMCITVKSPKMGQRRYSFSDYMNVPIRTLMDWDEYMQCCVDMIVATTMTDFRLAAISVNIIKEWPRPSCFCVPTTF